MPVLEEELRRAMAEEVAALHVDPGLAHRVLRRSRRRAARVRGLAAVAAAVVVGAGATVGYGQAWRSAGEERAVGAATPPEPVEGMVLTYLPGELVGTRPVETGRGEFSAGPLRVRATAWGPGEEVRLLTYRGAELADPVEALGDIQPEGTWTSVRGRTARQHADAGTATLAWLERTGLAIRLTVAGKYAGDLRRIAEGVRVADPTGPAGGVFEGMRVGHLPPSLHLEGTGTTVAPSGSSTYKRWTGANGAVMSLTALRGTGAHSLADLAAWARLGEERVRSMREVTVHGTTGYTGTVRDGKDRWHVHLWLERPGLGFLLRVSEPLAGELDRVREGITPAETRVSGEQVDGIAVTHLPPGLTRGKSDETGEGDGWSSVEGRWLAPSGKPRVRILIARGGGIFTSGFAERVLGPGAEEAAIGGRTGRLAEAGDGTRRFLVFGDGVAAVVTVHGSLAKEIDAIVRGLRLPGA